MSSRPRLRSRAYYCAVLALPLIVLAVLLASGRFQASWAVFDTRQPPSPDTFREMMVTNLVWLLGLAPLLYAAWELGREHTAARRLGFGLLVGLREVVRVARGAPPSAAQLDEYARPPRDRPDRALLFGLAVGVFVPTFFLSAMPFQRTPQLVLWLVGTGAIMGFSVYCHVRAAAYLVTEPGRWSFFRQWQLLDASRYEPAGRRFVRMQIAAAILLPVWWLGGGALVMSHM